MLRAFDLRDSPEWETRIRYYFLSTVRRDGRFFCCIEEHESDVFDIDLRDGRWQEFDPNEA